MASGGWEWPGFYRDQELYSEGRPASVRFVCALFYSSRRSDGAIARIARTRHTGPPAAFFFFFFRFFFFSFFFFSFVFSFFFLSFFLFSFRFFLFFFFGTPTHVSAAMAILANAMVGHGGVPELYNLKPVLNWANVCSPNILRTVRRTMIRFLIERLVRRTWFGQFDEPYFVLNWLVMRCKLRPELAADAQQTA